MSDLLKEIRDTNTRWYGEGVLQPGGPAWCKLIFERLYSDRTHCVYELLQNAEDACERKRRVTGDDDFKIHFKLAQKGLEVSHNGIIFDADDIKRICDIGREIEGEERKDIHQIGKFGIGFKSVYAYTKSPYVYSGDNAFRIENFVLPCKEERKEDLDEGETLFFIPLNREGVSPQEAYKEIEHRLKNLGLKTLLFLRNIKEITWEIDGKSGKYTRSCDFKDGFRWVILYQDDKALEKWLVFEKSISSDDKGRVIEIAYFMDEGRDKKIKRIVNARDTRLVVYFPTQKETRLNFLIQGPYNTTATRENIEKDDWNKKLILETGSIIVESITKIKSFDLLDVGFLNTLPIDAEDFQGENNVFKLIYDKVKEKLKSDEELLPADDGSYVSAKNALLARGADLRALLSNGQLPLLFNRTKWLNGEITQDKLPLVREYLMNELEVPEIDSERFARVIDEKFIKEQTDDWIIEFYNFLLGQKALWRSKTSWQSEGVLRSKPIIRLEDGSHMKPFDGEGKVQVYLPPSDKEIKKQIREYFKMVKDVIIKNPKTNEFLKELGIIEPDAIAGILEHILPKYRPWNKEWDTEGDGQDLLKISLEGNFRDVQWISKALKKAGGDRRREELLHKIKKTEFLYAKNMSDATKWYCSPDESIYLGEFYTQRKDIEIFFEGNDKIWLLDESYKEIVDIETLRLFGRKDEIHVRFREPSWNGHVVISNWSWNYERGLNGFDPDAEIEGLEHALNDITFEKSKIIWNLLTKYYKQIRGYVEFSTNQNYNPSSGSYSKDLRYSKMGELLIENTWLYKNGDTNPYKPTEIMLSELSNIYDKECPEAKIIEKYLEFITPIKEELKEKMNTDEWELYEVVEQATRVGIKDEVIEFIRKRLEDEKTIQSDKSPSDLASELESMLVSPIADTEGLSDEEIEVLIGPTPEEEEKIQKVHGDEIPQILKRLKLERKVKTSVEAKTTGGISMDQFLLDQYSGHCQICNVKLFLGNKERGKNGVEFVTTHLIETRNKKAYADMEWNVLCLCPNHFALFKYGITDLKGIWELANKVLNDEIAAEWVEERRGDYYIAKIKMMRESGKLEDTELFFSTTHMRKLVALLRMKDEMKD